MVPPLKEHGKAHRWILLEGVEHGVAREKQAQQFYPALFEFLDAHIGAKAASGEAVAASH